MGLVGASLVSCSRPKTEPTPRDKSAAAEKAQTSAGEGEHSHGPKRVQMSAKVIADAGIKTTPALRESLVATVDLPGAITADPDKSARVSSPVAGRLERVSFQEGSPVKR